MTESTDQTHITVKERNNTRKEAETAQSGSYNAVIKLGYNKCEAFCGVVYNAFVTLAP